MRHSLKSVKLQPGVCCYVGLFSPEDLQLCHKILSEHMAHTPGPQSESGHTWSAIAAWKRCQPRGGMCPRVSCLSVDNSVALCPWATFSTSITTFKNMFYGWQVINQDSVGEQMRDELQHSGGKRKAKVGFERPESAAKNNSRRLITHFQREGKKQWMAMKDDVIIVHKWQ